MNRMTITSFCFAICAASICGQLWAVENGAAAARPPTDPTMSVKADSLPDLDRGKAAAQAGRIDEAIADLEPLARDGYAEAALILARLESHRDTPASMDRAIAWLRVAAKTEPRQAQVMLGMLLIRRGGPGDIDEGERLLDVAYDAAGDADALVELLRLYTDHPERDREQRAAALEGRAEALATPKALTAATDWLRSQHPQGAEAEHLTQLCRKALDQVPTCYVDLLQVAIRDQDNAGIDQLVGGAVHAYTDGVADAGVLSSMADRLLTGPGASPADAGADDAANDSSADAGDDPGAAATSAPSAPVAGKGACDHPPIELGATVSTASASSDGEPANPEQLNALVEAMLHGTADGPLRAARLIVKQPSLAPDADLEKLLQTEAGNGSAEAALYLGELYLKGSRVPRSPDLARRYLQTAANDPKTANQGHYYLGQLYQDGYLGESQPVEAARHLLWAARRGETSADAALARLFASGRGVCPNPVDAWIFASMGALGGNSRASALLEQLNRHMTPEQRTQAEARAIAERRARMVADNTPPAPQRPHTPVAVDEPAGPRVRIELK